MLVLSRKLNQSVVIDGQIEIQILKIKGNTIRLGITAPKDIKVLRGELSPFEIEKKMSKGVAEELTRFASRDVASRTSAYSVSRAS